MWFAQRNKNDIFHDKLEHSVIPSMDYPYAKEFYQPSDKRYNLVKAFENLIWETKNIKPYNCKIAIPQSAVNFYNVYLYFYDIKKTLGNDYNPLFNKNEDFIVLFRKALNKCPLRELAAKSLNPNGIFVLDFLTCAQCYAISEAEEILKTNIKAQYPMIEFLTVWDRTIYVFFKDKQSVDDFLKEENIKGFKQFSFNIIERFDVEHVWQPETLSFMLDVYENYSTIGGRNYFNSDAMSAGVFI